MRVRIALAAVAMSGCPEVVTPADGGDAPPPCIPNGATLVVGTGTDPSLATYRALRDGDDVYLTPGPQGAQHVWIGLRGRGFDPSQPRINFTAIRPSDGEVLGTLRIRLRMSPAPEDASLLGLSSQTLVIEDDRYCSVLPGEIRVLIRLDDERGHCVQAERRVRLAGVDPLALPIDRDARLRCCAERLSRCFPLDAGTTAPITGDAAPD